VKIIARIRVLHDAPLAAESLRMTFPRRSSRVGSWLAIVLLIVPTSARAQGPDPDLRRETRFLQGLRDRGYFDLASEYIDRLREAADTPASVKAVLDIEQARGRLEEAVTLVDLNRRIALLEQARAGLDAAIKAHPDAPQTPESLATLARVLLERGQTAALQAAESETAELKQAHLTEARAAFAEARKTYDRALVPLRKAFQSSPGAAGGSDNPAQAAVMDAELQRALVDYQEAQTYDPGSRQRNSQLDAARGEFKQVHEAYRTRLAGFFAQMWEAKCYEEKGEVGPAMGIYDELLNQPDPALAPLKRKVAYFRILIHGRRGEHALAVDRAEEWLKANPGEIRTEDGLGVRYQLARNLLDQLPKLKAEEKTAATRRAVEVLAEVVKDPSPFRSDAAALLKKYRPQGAESANSIAALNFDDAFNQARVAASTHEWERALALLRQAARRAEATRDQDKVNHARYTLAYCYFAQGNYYAAAVVAEHLARNYPKWTLAPKSPDINSAKAAEIALAAWTYAYNSYTTLDRPSDLDRLLNMARDTAATWPDTDTGDAARVTLGEVELGRGKFLEAAKAFESVRESSPRRNDALVKAGEAHWKQSVILRDQGKDKEADAAKEADTAVALLEKALAARREAKVPPTDPGFLENINTLAEVYRLRGEHKKVLDLVEPIVKSLGDGPFEPDVAKLRNTLVVLHLRAHIANGQPDDAIRDMVALEKSGGEGSAMTQLYFELGRSLKREIETLETKPDAASKTRLEQTRQTYARFLDALVKSPSGHTFESLLFGGDALLELGRAKEALGAFDTILKDFADQASSSDAAQQRLLRVRLRRAEALRKDGQFEEAQKTLEEIKKENPRLLEAFMEQGLLYEDWAVSEAAKGSAGAVQKRWGTAYNQWKMLASQLERGRPRRNEYYEVQYHAAVALAGLKQKAQAAQVLRGVMTLSPTVGTPTMKAKYEALLAQLSKAK
jgi:tetratricopeptide (TPR) repeat protein